MKRRATVAALALLVPLGAGTSVAVAQERPAARVVHAASRAITLNGAGANSIDPFFQAVFYNYHQQVPQGHHQLLPGGQQCRGQRHPAEHRGLRRHGNTDGGQGPGQGEGDRAADPG